MFEILLRYPDVNPFSNLLTLAQNIKDNLTITNTLEQNNEDKFSSSSKEQPIVNKNKIEIEEGSQSTKNMLQIHPLLFPNIMLNPQIQNNFQNNQNMMFYPYNPMMAQPINQQQQKPKQKQSEPKMDFEILSKSDLSPIEKIKSSYYVSDSSSVNALKELKALGNKYKNVFTVDDKNRLDFLIDSLSKKL